MREVRLSPRAVVDLDAIWDFTISRWDEDQAERYIRAIIDACDRLAAGTLPGQDAGHIRAGYRKCPVGAHVVFYRETPASLEVIRILHERMDFRSHLD